MKLIDDKLGGTTPLDVILKFETLEQAKIENERAHFNQGVKRTEFHSKETRWQTRKDRITRGTSIERSDNYSQALYAKGIANQNLAELYKQKQQTSVGTSFKTGESVSSKKGFATYKAILDKQNAIERSIDNVFGRQWHAKEQRIQQHYQANMAKNRQALGVPGAFGGGREGVQRAEYQAASDRNRAQTFANLQQQGFQNAAARRQQDLANQMNISNLQSGLGARAQDFSRAQISGLGTLGAAQQAQQQAVLDAQRQAAQMAAMEPYQRLGAYLSLIHI